MSVTFAIETRSSHTPEALFDISLSIDAHLEAFAASRESAVAGVTSGHIGMGETVTWRARHFGLWFVLTSKVTSLERPVRFVDEQVEGPFRVFVHEHRFRTEGCWTVMTDTVTVGSPVFGLLIDRMVLEPHLRRLITRRNTLLLRILDAKRNGTGSA